MRLRRRMWWRSRDQRLRYWPLHSWLSMSRLGGRPGSIPWWRSELN